MFPGDLAEDLVGARAHWINTGAEEGRDASCCAAGTYSGVFAGHGTSPLCKLCPAGTFARVGFAACADCALGKDSPIGAAACTSTLALPRLYEPIDQLRPILAS
jgi:hypothetical protein